MKMHYEKAEEGIQLKAEAKMENNKVVLLLQYHDNRFDDRQVKGFLVCATGIFTPGYSEYGEATQLDHCITNENSRCEIIQNNNN